MKDIFIFKEKLNLTLETSTQLLAQIITYFNKNIFYYYFYVDDGKICYDIYLLCW